MRLLPLRFSRGPVWLEDVDGPARIGPIYGRGTYVTDCGRFLLHHGESGWQIRGRFSADVHIDIATNVGPWARWLDGQGLKQARFVTRRETLEALESCLAADGLLAAARPA